MIDGYNFNYRIGTSESDLQRGNFFVREIPPPDVPAYNDASVSFETSDGDESRHGYQTIKLMWDRLTPRQFYAIRSLVDASKTTGDLYLTIDKSWSGQGNRGRWIDVKGKASVPTGSQLSGFFGFDNVVLIINNVTIVNDPAVNL